MSEHLVSTLRAGSDAADRHRQLPDSSVEMLKSEGFFKLCLPAEYGGPGLSAVEVFESLRAVGAIDGAAGWCSMISSTTSALAGFLEPEVATATFGSGQVFGGVFAPLGHFVTDGPTATLSGRWQWGSGLTHCDVVVAGATNSEGERRTFVLNADSVKLEDTWHTVGMRGSGSVDFHIDQCEVNLSHSVPQVNPTLFSTDPICAFPTFALLAGAVASVAAGIAEHAFDEVLMMAQTRRPQFSRRTMAEHAVVQSSLSRQRVCVDAAWTHLVHTASHITDRIHQGSRPTLDDRVAVRSAASHVAASAKNAVGELFELAGGAAVYDTSDLGRCLRDIHVVGQHIMVADRLHETLGRHLLDIEIESGMI